MLKEQPPSHSDVKKKFIRVVYEYNKDQLIEIKEDFTKIHGLFLAGHDAEYILLGSYQEHQNIIQFCDSEKVDLESDFCETFKEYYKIIHDYSAYIRSFRGPTGAH